MDCGMSFMGCPSGTRQNPATCLCEPVPLPLPTFEELYGRMGTPQIGHDPRPAQTTIDTVLEVALYAGGAVVVIFAVRGLIRFLTK